VDRRISANCGVNAIRWAFNPSLTPVNLVDILQGGIKTSEKWQKIT
jgi:hypothetical protein